jgi:hypothetical protein
VDYNEFRNCDAESFFQTYEWMNERKIPYKNIRHFQNVPQQ